jgi:FSR family fosmidomycin resistance protein-like MFS transporter
MISQPGSALLKRVKNHIPGLRLDLSILTLMHFLVDLHSGMLPVILLYQRQVLNLSLTQVGIIAGVYNFGISLSQPLFGHLADRFGERRFAFGGLIWIALLSAGLGFAPNFGGLLLIAALAALGSSSFHPAGATGASRLIKSGRGYGMSFFLVGGSIGYAVGPLVAVGVFESIGLHGTLWITLGALLLATLMMVVMRPLWPVVSLVESGAKPAQKLLNISIPKTILVGVIALIILSGARTWIYQGLSNFIPQQMTALGFARVEATHWLSIMLMLNSAGVLIGGLLTDRFGPRIVMTGSLSLLVPALFLIAGADTSSIGPLAVVAGFLVGLPVATVILVGQSFLPQGTGLASGLVLGISFTIGAAGVAITGVIADYWSLPTAILSFGFLALAAAVSGLAMPKTIPLQNLEKETTSVPWME